MYSLTHFDHELLELAGFRFDEDSDQEGFFIWRRYCKERFIEGCDTSFESIDEAREAAYDIMVDNITSDLGLEVNDWGEAEEAKRESWVREIYAD